MPRCSFCKRNYEFPRGLSFIKNDGNVLYFCSSKCRKNMLYLKRDNKKVSWVRKSGKFEKDNAGSENIEAEQNEKGAKQA
jgi:large subunit ribosomal protein L24e